MSYQASPSHKPPVPWLTALRPDRMCAVKMILLSHMVASRKLIRNPEPVNFGGLHQQWSSWTRTMCHEPVSGRSSRSLQFENHTNPLETITEPEHDGVLGEWYLYIWNKNLKWIRFLIINQWFVLNFPVHSCCCLGFDLIWWVTMQPGRSSLKLN